MNNILQHIKVFGDLTLFIVKNIHLILILTVCIFVNKTSYSQTDLKPKQEKKLVRKGRKAYRKVKFWQAKSYFDKVTNANTTNPLYWFEAGLVYYDSKVEIEKSLPKFEQALTLSVQDTAPEILMYLGHAYHFTSDFETAIAYYNLFKGEIKDNKKGIELAAEVDLQIEICNNGIDLRIQENKRYATVENMGYKVNSSSADYAPVIANDENLILFCSRRPPGKKRNFDGQYVEDIFYTSKTNDTWKQATVIDKNSGYVNQEKNNGKHHEAPISLSPNGNTLFIYKENSVWKSTKDRRGQWSIPKRMNQNVNIGSFNPSLFITPNGTEMFIVSVGAEGGLGGRDIFHTELQEDGTWAEPKNLGPTVNTELDEDAPFMSSDGKTLYFASNGHKTMGGYDIFKTVKDDKGEWSKPVNIGTPINSAGDDIYYVENDLGTIAYYASQRPGSFGYLDIYTAQFECNNIPTTVINGYAVYANNHQPVDGIIKITNKTTGEEMGTYEINPNKGTYNMVLPPNETYLLELMVAQSKYNQVRPHVEEFYIPKQCNAYNLFQQISINYLMDSTGKAYAQKAHFRNAMFDIESEIINDTDVNLYINTTFADSSTYIQGHLAYDSVLNAINVVVTLLNEKNEILRITKTDDNGEYAFEQIDISKKYIVMINEDDAKIGYYGDNSSNQNASINLVGTVFKYKNKYKFASENTSVYLSNTNKLIVNKSETNSAGTFTVNNTPDDTKEITTLNKNTVISYNMDIPTKEVSFSVYINKIDPNNTDLAYTEFIDIIELKDFVASDNGPDFANIYFDFDKYFLRQKSVNILDNLYSFLADNPNSTVRLDGHTDWFGTEPYNVVLSENRSLKAYKYLIDKGIAPNRLINEWFGETSPAVANANLDDSDNPENRQLNRRVEIKVQIPEMAALYIQL
jgi:outer membrane protein OmpA-like peptidoglycan-associated protein/tetratricopeptide (TPR) repeat protein